MFRVTMMKIENSNEINTSLKHTFIHIHKLVYSGVNWLNLLIPKKTLIK